MSKLSVWEDSYELDFKAARHERHVYGKSPSADDTVETPEGDKHYRKVHIVRIKDHSDIQINSVRVYGIWEEVEEFAETWLYELLRANPTKGLKYTIEDFIRKIH